MSLAPLVRASIRIRSTRLTIGEALALELASLALTSRSSRSLTSCSTLPVLGRLRSLVRERCWLVLAAALAWAGSLEGVRGAGAGSGGWPVWAEGAGSGVATARSRACWISSARASWKRGRRSCSSSSRLSRCFCSSFQWWGIASSSSPALGEAVGQAPSWRQRCRGSPSSESRSGRSWLGPSIGWPSSSSSSRRSCSALLGRGTGLEGVRVMARARALEVRASAACGRWTWRSNMSKAIASSCQP